MRPPSLRRRIEAAWYGDSPLGTLLAPLGWCYGAAVMVRRKAYARGVWKARRVPVPVVVVGNVAVGGTGKTPVVQWLVARAQRLGFHPGIVARGYGGRVGRGPRLVATGDAAELVGDEPLLHHRACGVPVAVGADRPAAALLVASAGCDLVIADDGLQHLALARDREVVVVDGARLAGNGRLLPAGPLREPWSRLGDADLVLVNGEARPGARWPVAVPRQVFDLAGYEAVAFAGGRRVPLAAFTGGPVRALAGIGNPERFHRLLRAAGLVVRPVPVDDHGRARPADLAGNGPLLMTEKDAVKYASVQAANAADWWVVPVAVRADAAAERTVDRLLAGLRPGTASAWPGTPER